MGIGLMQPFLSHFKLQTKLLAGFAVLLCVLFLASSLIRLRLMEAQVEIDIMVNDRRPLELRAIQLNARLDDAIAQLGLFVSVRDQGHADGYRAVLEDVYRIADELQMNPLVRDEPRYARMLREIRFDIDDLSQHGNELLALSSHHASSLPETTLPQAQIDPLTLEMLQQRTTLADELRRTDSYLMGTEIGPLFERIKSRLETFAREQHTGMDQVAGNLLDHSRTIAKLSDLFLFLGILLGIAMTWGISRLFTRPIQQISAAMERIAAGETDLNQRLEAVGRDEVAQLARSFNSFAEKAQQSADEAWTLSALLHLSLKPSPLQEYLEEALRQMTGTINWLSPLSMGAIHLTFGAGDKLQLTAAHNLSPRISELCGTVPVGECLCGQAAMTSEIVFSASSSPCQGADCEDIEPHGHYAVPIKSGASLLGVMLLYLPEGHPCSVREEHFLYKVAEVLSMGISLRQANAELLNAKQQAETVSDRLTGITANIPGILYQYRRKPDGTGEFTYVSPGTAGLLGNDIDDPKRDIWRLFSDIHHQDKAHLTEALQNSAERLQPVNLEYRILQPQGGTRWVLCNALPRRYAEGDTLWDGLLLDITDRKTLESQLLQAQKLESVGQLAAGIAHEINTPTQFVQDNTRFLKKSFTDYLRALTALRRLREGLPEQPPGQKQLDEVDRLLEEIEIDFLAQDIPLAIDQSLEGLQRIASIVSAMKEFVHPGTDVKQPVDINAVIGNIVTVSRNEWKYVADVATDLEEELPKPAGHRDKLGQVILNLIVNAAHAIADEVKNGRFEKGLIRITTRKLAEAVEIRVSDNGPGIPQALQQKVFEPFFTTKAAGKGTGQGLTIARSVVVEQHGGELALEDAADAGATFIIRLPLQAHRNDD